MGLGRGPTTDDEVFSLSADFECFRKKGEGLGRGPLMMMKDYLFPMISMFYEGAH